MSIMVGVGRGAQAGVLIRNAEALERMEKVDTLVLDKTGTLTEGRPKVVAIMPAEGFDEAELLRLAASVERASEHPLGRAIVEAAAERKHRACAGARLRFARPARARSAWSSAAASCSATRDSWASSASRPHALEARGRAAAPRGRDRDLRRHRRQARRRHRHRRSGEGDAPRRRSRRCKAEGMRIVMLTGDNRTTARRWRASSASTRSRPRCCPTARAR